MVKFIFTKYAEKVLRKFPQNIQERILEKLAELKKHDNIFALLKGLHGCDHATHRLRIGNYRVILALKWEEEFDAEFLVLDVGDRKNIYQ